MNSFKIGFISFLLGEEVLYCYLFIESVAQILHEPIYKVWHKSCTNLYTKCGTDPARTYIQSVAQILHEPIYKVWHKSCTNVYKKCGTDPARTYIQSAAQILYELI